MRPLTHHTVLRWLSVVLRGLHLVTVIGLGAAVMGAPLSLHQQSIGVLVTGIAMIALDLWNKPRMLMEWSGAALVIKLGVIALMVLNRQQFMPMQITTTETLFIISIDHYGCVLVLNVDQPICRKT